MTKGRANRSEAVRQCSRADAEGAAAGRPQIHQEAPEARRFEALRLACRHAAGRVDTVTFADRDELGFVLECSYGGDRTAIMLTPGVPVAHVFRAWGNSRQAEMYDIWLSLAEGYRLRGVEHGTAEQIAEELCEQLLDYMARPEGP